MIEERSATALRDIDPELHLEQGVERTVYSFVRTHFDELRMLPTFDVVFENTGVVLPPVDQPLDYYFRRTRQRSMFLQISDPYNRFQAAMQTPQQSMGDIAEIIDEMHYLKGRFLERGTGIETSQALLDSIIRQVADRRFAGGILRGIPTGYLPMDLTMDGYNDGDLVVWVGRPGRSKSWFLLKQCHAAWMAGYKPLYVSMEMGGEQNMRRILGIHTGINPTFIKRGELSTLAHRVFDRGVHELMEKRPLQMVTANFSRTVDQIANFIETHNPDIVFIDAGYLLSPKKKRFGAGGRRETISDVIEELKELASNSGKPFVITVQFNRQAEHRRRSGAQDGVLNPIAHLSLAEIGETDVIGQTASHVLGIEYAPAPLVRDAYRVFGFLKGREGETGWWLTNFMERQHHPVNLSLVEPDDPAYEILRQHAARPQQNGPTMDPSRRTSVMRLNRDGNDG